MTIAPYNFTNLTTGNTLVSIIDFANQITDYWFSNLIILGIFLVFVIAFISTKNDTASSFLASSLITTLLAFLLKLITNVQDSVIFLCILATAGSFIALILSKKA